MKHGLKQLAQQFHFKFRESLGKNGNQAWRILRRALSRGPVILCVDHDQHWITAIGKLAEKVIIFDSKRTYQNCLENGVYILSRRQLLFRWKGPRGRYYALIVFP